MEDKDEAFSREISFFGKTVENASEEYAVAGTTNENKMVKLEAVEYDYDNQDDEYYINNPEKYGPSDVPNPSEFSNEEYGADEPTFQQAEEDTVNVAMKLGDNPRQQVDMSLYSSAPKPAVKIWLLVLTAVLFWRG